MENSTSSSQRLLQGPPSSLQAPPSSLQGPPSSQQGPPSSQQGAPSDSNAFLYILIVMSFYGFFLCVIMLGYFRSKRREKRRVNVFTKLVHDKEKQEWGALPHRRHPLPFPPGLGLALCTAGHSSPLACALCPEQSSVSSLCSSADTRLAIEEEDDVGAACGPDEAGKSSGDDSG